MTVKSESNYSFNLCPDCNSLNSIVYNEDRAEQTCQECGLVVKHRIFDTSIADERYFNRIEMNRRARTGPPIPDHLSKLTLSTTIDKTDNWEQNRVFRRNGFIIIIRPPAVGKMAVGLELAKRTGFKLLHNHMTIDLVSNNIPTPPNFLLKLFYKEF
jgi:transcription initiation factor TFIIIB Brf1 subunit/transcription initiation factor TFIIB